MGALVDGFETARQKHETELAEARSRERVAEEQLRGLGKLLDEDATFLREHAMTHTLRAHALHIDQKRAPLITAHFDPSEKTFLLTFMRDASRLTCTTPEGAAKAIGGHVYDTQRQK
jgi:hypothetical protein